MDWGVKAADAANHNPVAAFNGDASRDADLFSGTSGSIVTLSAADSSDPDGDGRSYPEPGTFGSPVALANANQASASFTVSVMMEPKNVHRVLRVRDDGTPAPFSYKRIVVTVSPRGGTSIMPSQMPLQWGPTALLTQLGQHFLQASGNVARRQKNTQTVSPEREGHWGQALGFDEAEGALPDGLGGDLESLQPTRSWWSAEIRIELPSPVFKAS